MYADFDDLGEEMSHVQGAVVVRRPDLTQSPNLLMVGSNKLDFAKTFDSYLPMFRDCLLSR